MVVVFSKPDKLGTLADPLVYFNSPDPHADSKDLTAVSQHLRDVSVGFVVCILDRQNKRFIAHARPLLLDQRRMSELERARRPNR